MKHYIAKVVMIDGFINSILQRLFSFFKGVKELVPEQECFSKIFIQVILIARMMQQVMRGGNCKFFQYAPAAQVLAVTEQENPTG
jgi:hypothetical protein